MKQALLALFLFLLFISTLKAQVTTSDSSFRIFGYYSLNYAMKKSVQNFPFQKLTHVNLYFVNPDSSGNYKLNLIMLVPFFKAPHKKI